MLSVVAAAAAPSGAEAAKLSAEVQVNSARSLSVFGELAGGGVLSKEADRWRVRVEQGSASGWKVVGSGKVGKSTGRRHFQVPVRLPARAESLALRIKVLSPSGQRRANTVELTVGFLKSPTDRQAASPAPFAVGGWHLCRKDAAGSVSCAGNNFSGELGVFYPFSPEDIPTDRPWATQSRAFVSIPGLSVQSVTAGARHACAVQVSGSVVCWGSNEAGQLGIGRGPGRAGYIEPGITYSDSPVPVEGIGAVSVLEASEDSVCAIQSGGAVSCWGVLTGTRSPVAISGLRDPIRLSVSDSGACAVQRDGTVSCWGTTNPALNGQSPSRLVARSIPGITDAVAASTSAGIDSERLTCVVRASGTATCWSDGYGRELSRVGRDQYKSKRPIIVSGLADAVDIVASGRAMCFLRVTGAVGCLGERYRGGTPDPATYATPTPVKGLSDAAGLDASDVSVCARRATGQISCWGNVPPIAWDERPGGGMPRTLNAP